jgi:hypothetical protein
MMFAHTKWQTHPEDGVKWGKMIYFSSFPHIFNRKKVKNGLAV